MSTQGGSVPQSRSHGFDRLLDIDPGVGHGDEAGLKLRGGQVNAGIQAAMEETGEGLAVGALGVGEVGDGAAGEEEAEH